MIKKEIHDLINTRKRNIWSIAVIVTIALLYIETMLIIFLFSFIGSIDPLRALFIAIISNFLWGFIKTFAYVGRNQRK